MERGEADTEKLPSQPPIETLGSRLKKQKVAIFLLHSRSSN